MDARHRLGTRGMCRVHREASAFTDRGWYVFGRNPLVRPVGWRYARTGPVSPPGFRVHPVAAPVQPGSCDSNDVQHVRSAGPMFVSRLTGSGHCSHRRRSPSPAQPPREGECTCPNARRRRASSTGRVAGHLSVSVSSRSSGAWDPPPRSARRPHRPSRRRERPAGSIDPGRRARNPRHEAELGVPGCPGWRGEVLTSGGESR